MTNLPFLYDMWYMAMPGRKLKTGKMTSKTILGQKILIMRSENNEVFAMRDLCPHRGIPLSYGEFDGKEITCRYHGWQFNTTGQCTAIPSLTAEQNFKISRVKVCSYPCQEVQGNIWVFVSQMDSVMSADPPPVPTLPEIGNQVPQLFEYKLFPCDYDHAVVGLMDPAHGPFVHRSWWWRSKRSMHAKEKSFAPADFGFQMEAHQPSQNSKPYKLLGDVSTEITFSLQGLRRIERIKAGNRTIYALTTLTPITETTTEVYQFFYWNIPWLSLAKPILRRFVRAFLKQDYTVVKQQQDGLKEDPQLMLINDADTQAKWYYQLKKEYLLAQKEKRSFSNPVSKTILRWRS
jgi:phenylpropionate dioxygenase-like ring-hydroxylating dioxygenase large terminal subunit